MEQKSFAVEVIEQVRGILEEEDLVVRHRMHEKAFTRQRSLTFVRVMLLVLQKTLKSVQLHLNEFFQALAAGTPSTVSASAWTQARAKLSHSVFVELNRRAVVEVVHRRRQELTLWRGHRLLANDGSLIRLPQRPELFEHFGGHAQIINQTGDCGVCVPMARLSVLYDCLNRIVLDARVGKHTDGEKKLSIQHLSAAHPGDIIVADRGYAGYLLLAEYVSKGMHFVVRCNQQCFKPAAELFLANQHGRSITVSLPARSRQAEAKAAGLPLELKVRFVSLRLPGGELEVLVTSLLDETLYPTEEFLELYHLRWGVETFYGMIKGRLDLENFSGLTVEAVLQDIHATIFLSNLESVVTRNAQAQLSHPEETQKQRRYCKKVNRAVSFHALKMRAIELLIGQEPVEKVLEELETLFMRTPVSVRPERIRPRRQTPRDKLIHFFRYFCKIVF